MKDQLYYDGSCPLCSKEIGFLKPIAGEHLDFVDIQQLKQSPTTENIPATDKLLKRLHLRKADGKWLIGLDANVYAWSFSRYGFFLKILRWPLIRQVADLVYCSWADKRYDKRYGCGSCGV